MKYANGGFSLVTVSEATARVEDGCVSKNFPGVFLVLVSRAYANKFPQETSVDRFLTPFPYTILSYLVSSHTVARLTRNRYAVMDGACMLEDYGV